MGIVTELSTVVKLLSLVAALNNGASALFHNCLTVKGKSEDDDDDDDDDDDICDLLPLHRARARMFATCVHCTPAYLGCKKNKAR